MKDKITGYRELTQGEINLINEAKRLAEMTGQFIDKLVSIHQGTGNHEIDMRWVSIGKTDLQTGFMALVRSIGKPESF